MIESRARIFEISTHSLLIISYGNNSIILNAPSQLIRVVFASHCEERRGVKYKYQLYEDINTAISLGIITKILNLASEAKRGPLQIKPM